MFGFYIMGKLKAGDKAPLFSAPDQDGETVSLESFRGRKVILYFYPRDNTPGCTAEACSLRDGRDDLAEMGFAIIGVSPDSVASHEKFRAKHSLNFTLLSDADKAIATAYGVWGEKKFMGKTTMGIRRTTFIIDEAGAIEKIFDKVDTKNHWRQIADSYK